MKLNRLKDLFKSSVNAKLTFLVLVTPVLLMIYLLADGLIFSNLQLRKEAQNSIKIHQTLSEAKLQNIKEKYYESCVRISNDVQFVVPVFYEVNYQVYDFLQKTQKKETLNSIALLNPDGNLIVSNDSPTKPTLHEKITSIPDLLQRKCFFQKIDGKLLITSVVKISYKSKILGFLITSRELLQTDFDDNVILMTQENFEKSKRSNSNLSKLFNKEENYSEATRSTLIKHGNIFIGSKKIIDYNEIEIGSVFFTVDFIKRLKSVHRATFFRLFFIFLITLLTVIFAFLFSRLITDPIINLSKITHKVANNDFSAKPEVIQRNDEIGILNNDFVAMIENLQNTYQHLRESKKEADVARVNAEVASKVKAEFLANMSHELRTPLNSILILARDLSRNRKGNLDDKQTEASEIIYNSGNDLLNLINEILDLSKVEAGKMTTNIQYIPLKDVANNLKTLFTHQIEQKGLEFNIILSDELPETILTDQQRLEQIIKNLISNAIKFTSKGGITISFKRPDETADLSLSGLYSGKAVAVAVSDTGIGIPKEKQVAIFESFQQADGSTSRKYGGTGLGLSISKELSKLLGGELQLESVEGKGSTFTAYISEEMKEIQKDIKSVDRRKTPDRRVEKELPTMEEIKERIPAPSIDDDRKNIDKDDRTILIVEDDLNFARTLKRFCKDNHFKFIHSGDGETGLILAEEYLPQAIILDIKLPGIDGWTVLDKLKENKQLRHIPVHIMSVYEESTKALNKGAIGYLTKPVSADQINSAFNKIESFISKEIKDLLIVENDDNIRKSVLKLIDNENVKITTKNDGKTALNIIKNGKFDCMILDLELPDISGFEVLKKLKYLKDINVPPIIIYTGKEITQEEEYELHKYANSMIIKGVKSKERLLDETTLFLHQVVNKLPQKDQKVISMLHDKNDLFKRKKILVVDDDMRNVFAVSSILEDREMIISTASNGKKALEELEKEPDIDLVLMDIMMPVMDGYEAMKRIRAQKKFAALPIIALTAKAMKGDKEKCIAAGASDYLSKPLDMDKVLSLLRVWLYK